MQTRLQKFIIRKHIYESRGGSYMQYTRVLFELATGAFSFLGFLSGDGLIFALFDRGFTFSLIHSLMRQIQIVPSRPLLKDRCCYRANLKRSYHTLRGQDQRVKCTLYYTLCWYKYSIFVKNKLFTACID